MTMRTSYRDIALLACCQALLLINNSGLIAMNGLVGYALVENKAFATLQYSQKKFEFKGAGKL